MSESLRSSNMYAHHNSIISRADSSYSSVVAYKISGPRSTQACNSSDSFRRSCGLPGMYTFASKRNIVGHVQR
eukprot:4719-Heterococcus_DN1.PRE.2